MGLQQVWGHRVNLLGVTLDTRRLTIRPLHSGDLHSLIAGLREYFVSDAVRLMWPHPPKDIAQTRDFLARARASLVAGESYAAAIERKGVDFVGAAFLDHVTTATPELGVWVTGNQGGRGYGYEAGTALLGWVRANLVVEYVRFNAVRGNGAGVALARKLGGEELGERVEPDGTRLVEFALR